MEIVDVRERRKIFRERAEMLTKTNKEALEPGKQLQIQLETLGFVVSKKAKFDMRFQYHFNTEIDCRVDSESIYAIKQTLIEMNRLEKAEEHLFRGAGLYFQEMEKLQKSPIIYFHLETYEEEKPKAFQRFTGTLHFVPGLSQKEKADIISYLIPHASAKEERKNLKKARMLNSFGQEIDDDFLADAINKRREEIQKHIEPLFVKLKDESLRCFRDASEKIKKIFTESEQKHVS